MPVEVDVVELADQQHVHIGFDHIREHFKSAQRPRLARHVNDQDTWRWCLAQYVDGATYAASMELTPRGTTSLSPSRRMLSVSASVTKATISGRSGRAGA